MCIVPKREISSTTCNLLAEYFILRSSTSCREWYGHYTSHEYQNDLIYGDLVFQASAHDSAKIKKLPNTLPTLRRQNEGQLEERADSAILLGTSTKEK